MGNHRRPHMALRVGDQALVIGYEQRGSQWVLYRHLEGQAPNFTDQAHFQTVKECHQFWLQACHEALAAAEGSTAPLADAGTRKAIQVFLDDIPQMGNTP